MVTVAKNFDVPIKLMFPFDWNSDPAKFSILGLGDIVIPGIFVALCLKYDIDKNIRSVPDLRNVKTPLFNSCFIGYIAGIIMTYAAMYFTAHAQPALLYLVPCCTIAVLGKGYLSGELKQI
jgi:minor histocompatibility antigen H13